MTPDSPAQAQTPVISLSNVRKQYRTDLVATTAVNDVTLNIHPGEFVSIMGPSGCGKSTLLNLMALLDTPDAGSMKLLGEETAHTSETRRTSLRRDHIGVVFQSFNLIEGLTARENIELALHYQGVRGNRARELAYRTLADLGIRSRAEHRASQLSGGQQQRVAIARSVVGSPDVLLADEPTGNLDSESRGDVLALLHTLNSGGTTIVMVTHSPDDASHASRVLRMADGRLVE
jgi:putative ABC transport system ATP-binding protein